MQLCVFNSRRKICATLGFVLLILILGQNAYAATYYSKVASGNFSLTSSWTADTVSNPNAAALTTSDIFIIRNGHSIALNGSRTVGQLTIRSGGTMTLSGNYTLTPSSPFTINMGGLLNLVTRQLTVAGSWINDGSITITTGRLTCNTGTGANNGSISITSTGRLIRTTGSFENTGTVTMVAGSYFTATTGGFTNSGTFTVTGTATITMGTGNFINSNTGSSVNFGSSNVVISGTASNQTIGGFTTTGRFTCSKTSGTLTLTGNVTAGGFTKSNGSTMSLGDGLEHTSTDRIILTAGTLDGGSSIFNVSVISTSAWGGGSAAVFTPTTSTVNFTGAGNQTLSASGTKTFYNLTFSGSGTKTCNSTTVNNIFTLQEEAVASTAPTYGAGATLRYNTAVARDAGVEWVTPFVATGGVIIDSTGAISAINSKTFNEGVPLTIMPESTLSAGANNFSFSGDFINNGSWAPSSGNVTIAGTINQDIGGFTTSGTVFMTKTDGVAILQGNMNTANLEMNGSGGVFRLGNSHTHTVTGTWTNTAGTLRGNSSTLNVDGNVSGTSITFLPNNSTVHFRGAAPQAVPEFTYNNLEFSGAGLKTLQGNTVVGEVLTINTGTELDAGAHTLEFSGTGTPFINNGTFTASTSTVSYTNATSAVIAALNYYNLNGTGGNRTLSIADTIGIAGIFTPGDGEYVVDDSIVDFNGEDEQDIPAFVFHELLFSNGSNKRINASITVTCQAIHVTDGASMEINATGGGKLDIVD